MRSINRHRPRILTAGYLTLDLIVRDQASRDFWRAVGGTCGNVSVFASELGCEVVILARVGEDQRGQRLIEKLAATTVDISHVERVQKLSTPGIVELVRSSPEGRHKFTRLCPICDTRLPKASVVSKRKAEDEVHNLAEFDAFFFDRATSATVRLAESAHRAGLLVLFEPSSTPRGIWAKRASEASDIVKFSVQPGLPVEKWLPGKSAATKFLVHTLGPQGARILGKTNEEWEEICKLPASEQPCIRDTAGAGDWLTAGLLTNLLQKPRPLSADSIKESVKYGQKLSAVSLAFDGPGGALAALGIGAVERMARGLQPMHLPSGEESCVSPGIGSASSSLLHCELCLTELPPSGVTEQGLSHCTKWH